MLSTGINESSLQTVFQCVRRTYCEERKVNIVSLARCALGYSNHHRQTLDSTKHIMGAELHSCCQISLSMKVYRYIVRDGTAGRRRHKNRRLRSQWKRSRKGRKITHSSFMTALDRSFHRLSVWYVNTKRGTTSSMVGRFAGSSCTMSETKGTIKSRPR
jgi:hypothetical protein